MIGTPEIIALAALIVALIWGPSKIKEFARSFGEAQSEYKKGRNTAEDLADDVEDAAETVDE